MKERTPQVVEVGDVQGNVVKPYAFEYVLHLLLRVTGAAGARAALARLRKELTSSAPWAPGGRPATTANLGLSYAGLVAMEIPLTILAEFPYAFRAGMKKRAPILGDTGASAPESWEDGWRGDVHAIVTLHAKDPLLLAPRGEAILALVEGGFARSFEEPGGILTRDGFSGPGEHFGWTDGIGQTQIEGVGGADRPGDGRPEGDGWVPVAAGELLLGYLNEAQELPSPTIPAAIAKNGTFLVFRKLAQRVAAFRAYLKRHGRAYGDEEKLAAKMVGRWRDGTPLALRPDGPDPSLAKDTTANNAFGYADDPQGAKCPLGAHIRRARPRDAMGFGGRLANTRRIMRRGLPFGTWVHEHEEPDETPRGILFYAFNVDIEGQFEFIQQQWVNYGDHFGQGNDKDVIGGDHDGTGKAVIQASGPGDVPYLCTSLPRFVEVLGGEYFFVPGLAALTALAESV